MAQRKLGIDTSVRYVSFTDCARSAHIRICEDMNDNFISSKYLNFHEIKIMKKTCRSWLVKNLGFLN